MAKPINYPTVTDPAYKGAVSEIRTALNILGRRINSSPGLKTGAYAQIAAFLQANP